MKISCPKCQSLLQLDIGPEKFHCGSCGTKYSRTSDYIDLRLNDEMDTLLDIDSYDENHGVTGDAASCQLWRFYEKLLQRLGTNLQGRALEIASGSGHLSLGLIAESNFQEIFLSDISPRFMQLLRRKLNQRPEPKAEIISFLFDANYIPFDESSFDLIIGNSVLHHFATFESTLKSAYRVLKPGGVAIFGEPVMDTYVFMSLAAKLIHETCQLLTNHPLNQYDLMIVKAMSELAGVQMNNLRSSRLDLNHIEDKFVFPVNYMRTTSEEIGFHQFHCITPEVNNFSSVEKTQFARIFEQQKIDTTKIDYFNYIFDSIGDVYGGAMKEDLKAAFSFFAFIKK